MWNYYKFNRQAQNFVGVVEDEVVQKLKNILGKYNIAYDDSIHDFMTKVHNQIVTMDHIREILEGETNTIQGVIIALRHRELEQRVNELKKCQAKYKITERDFAFLCQATKKDAENDEKIKGIHNATQIMAEIQKIIYDTRALPNDFTAYPKSKQKPYDSLRRLLAGKLSDIFQTELAGKTIEGKPIEQYINDFIKDKIYYSSEKGNITKDELLEAAGFGKLEYPLRPEYYWPTKITEITKYSPFMKSKFENVIEIEKPGKIISAIRSELYKENTKEYDEELIKTLFKKFKTTNSTQQSDIENFLHYLKTFFTADNQNENDLNYKNESEIDQFLQDIREATNYSNSKRESKRDTQFNNVASFFDSQQEKQIVELIRDVFHIQCVSSNLQFPITDDFWINKKCFIVDFIMYCDVYNGTTDVTENGQKYTMPDITPQVIFVGEYYGGAGVPKDITLKQDLFSADGTEYAKKGQVVSSHQIYSVKTEYKKAVEKFCGDAIGCKTLSINAAASLSAQIQSISTELNNNRVIYNANGNVIKSENDQSDALKQLSDWFKSADPLSKEKSKGIIGKYFDFSLDNPNSIEGNKEGKDYKFTKYETAINEAKTAINAWGLAKAIAKPSGTAYTTSNIRDAKMATELLKQLKARAGVKSLDGDSIWVGQEDAWRIHYLNNLKKAVKNIENANGEINDSYFTECLRKTKFFFKNDDQELDEERLRKPITIAFNWFKRQIQGLHK